MSERESVREREREGYDNITSIFCNVIVCSLKCIVCRSHVARTLHNVKCWCVQTTTLEEGTTKHAKELILIHYPHNWCPTRTTYSRHRLLQFNMSLLLIECVIHCPDSTTTLVQLNTNKTLVK